VLHSTEEYDQGLKDTSEHGRKICKSQILIKVREFHNLIGETDIDTN
jgi:hypothetical protein